MLIAGSACGLITGPSSALQLGELEVQSTLGQPLRASIAFALNPNEQLLNHCIRLGSGRSPDGLPMLRDTSLSVANGNIMLTGTSPLREPMLALQITINCSYTANLTRSYTIMLDPARPAASPVTSVPVTASIAPEPVIDPGRSTVRTVVETTPIPLSTEYTVQLGDTLSGIATRIENRPTGLWPAVNAIFAANPTAFINGDVNRLKAGSRLTIPSLDNITVPTLSSNAVLAEPVAAVAESAADASVVYSGYVAQETATIAEPATLPSVELINEAPASESSLATFTDTSAMAAIQPGDISVGGDTPFVSPIETTIEPPIESTSLQPATVPDTVIAQPAPAVPVVTSNPRTSDNWSWMFWLAGSGMALILGLLMFGRKLRARFGSVAIGATVEAVIQDDDDTARNEALGEVDFPIQDAQSSDQEVTLDADLGAGTGLNDGGDIDVAQDFGFSADGDTSSDLDMLLPEESEQEAEPDPTDIIPLQRVEEASILVAEELPVDDEYDLSMIVDATKQPLGDDVSTEKDLKAVPIDSASDENFDVECTLNDQFGLDALQQDYEDELTATQAENLEIEKAAAELALRMAESPDDKTAEMPASVDVAEVTSEVTAQMPGTVQAENDDFSDRDDTGINDELTAQLPATESDATAAMVVESGHVNTKKSTG